MSAVPGSPRHRRDGSDLACMPTGICHRARRCITDRDAYVGAGTGNRSLDGDAHAISSDEADHCANVVADAIGNAGYDGQANTCASALPS